MYPGRSRSLVGEPSGQCPDHPVKAAVPDLVLRAGKRWCSDDLEPGTSVERDGTSIIHIHRQGDPDEARLHGLRHRVGQELASQAVSLEALGSTARCATKYSSSAPL